MELGFSVGNGFPLWFWSESLPEVECFKPFRFLFMSESRRWWRESIKVKLLIYRSIYIPNLIYSNELWVVTDGMRVQMVEMSFLWRVSGLSLRLRTLIIWESNSHYIPPHQKKVVWLSGEEVSWKAPRWSGFLGGLFNWEESQDMLEKWCGTPQWSSKTAGGGQCGRLSLHCCPCSVDRKWIGRFATVTHPELYILLNVLPFMYAWLSLSCIPTALTFKGTVNVDMV